MEMPGRVILSYVTFIVYAGSELDWHIRHANDDDRSKLALPIWVFSMLSRKCCGQLHIHKVLRQLALAREANKDPQQLMSPND